MFTFSEYELQWYNDNQTCYMAIKTFTKFNHLIMASLDIQFTRIKLYDKRIRMVNLLLLLNVSF